jgi:hypothetical protein
MKEPIYAQIRKFAVLLLVRLLQHWDLLMEETRSHVEVR